MYPKPNNAVLEANTKLVVKNNLEDNHYIILHMDPRLFMDDPHVFLISSINDPQGTELKSTRNNSEEYEYLILNFSEGLAKDSLLRLEFETERFIGRNQHEAVFKYETK